MLVFPNAKINLGLRVLHKRNDGYHELETIFYPIKLHDALEAIPATQLKFEATGTSIPDGHKKNLCTAAYQILKNKFPDLPAVHMHLLKKIPIGAGLGGGSSDGAFTLMLLNNMFSLGLNREQLIDLALQLGSDCPFFIINKPCIAKGRGELLQSIEIDLSKYKIILVHPGIHVSTNEAFTNFNVIDRQQKSLQDIITQPIATWKNDLTNELEPVVFKKYPEIEKIRHLLYDAGATYAAMSGSGSVVYGLFEKNALPELKVFSAYTVFDV